MRRPPPPARRGARRAAALALPAAAVAGCTLARPIDDLEPGPALACPAGMAAQRLAGGESFCIDELEVTQREYEAFVLATRETGQNVEGLAGFAQCGQNNDMYEPDDAGPCAGAFRPGETPNRPVTCVDFCDAAAYCLWRDKRLCGADGRGPQNLAGADGVANLNKPAADEWYVACVGGEARRPFPYGDAADGASCAVGRGDQGAADDVGSNAGCKTEAGVFDLSGNVAEWTYSCRDGKCLVRGGSYADADSALYACAAPTKEPAPPGRTPYLAANTRRRDVGIRCCDD